MRESDVYRLFSKCLSIYGRSHIAIPVSSFELSFLVCLFVFSMFGSVKLRCDGRVWIRSFGESEIGFKLRRSVCRSRVGFLVRWIRNRLNSGVRCVGVSVGVFVRPHGPRV